MKKLTFAYMLLAGVVSLWLTFHFLSASLNGLVLSHPSCNAHAIGGPALFLCLSRDRDGYIDVERSSVERRLVAWILPTPLQVENRLLPLDVDETVRTLYLQKGWIIWPAFIFNVMWYMALCLTPWLVGWVFLRKSVGLASTRQVREASGGGFLQRRRATFILIAGDLIALSFLMLMEQAQYVGSGSVYDLFYPSHRYRQGFLEVVGYASDWFFGAWLIVSLLLGIYRSRIRGTVNPATHNVLRLFLIAGLSALLYSAFRVGGVLAILPILVFYGAPILLSFFIVMVGWRALYAALSDPVEEESYWMTSIAKNGYGERLS